MDLTPDQVLDALTERYQRQNDAYNTAVALRDKRMEQLRGTLESDVTRLHNELRGTVEKIEMFGVKMELLTKDTVATPGAVVVVEKLHDVYRVHGVKYRGKQHTVDITRRLLDFGAKMTPDNWMQRYPSGFYGKIGVPDTEIYVQLALTLDNHEDHPDDRQRKLIAEVAGTLKSDFDKYTMVTSTKVTMTDIIHQQNTPRMKKIMHGKSQKIESWFSQSTESNVGAWFGGGGTTPYEINRAMIGITGLNTYVYSCLQDDSIFCYTYDGSFRMSSGPKNHTPGPVRGVAIRDNL